MPKGRKKPTPIEHAVVTETAPRRGRPSNADALAEASALAELALEVVRGGNHDADDRAEHLLSGSSWPGILEIQETARRNTRDQELSAWQALVFLMWSVIADEKAQLEGWTRMPSSNDKRKARCHHDVIFLNRYLLEGVSLRALESELRRHKSSIQRTFKKQIYVRLVKRALKVMRDGVAQSSHIDATMRDDIGLSVRMMDRRHISR